MQYNGGVDRLTMNPLLLCAILVTVTAATYAGAWHGDFQFDDVHSILDNPHLERWQTFLDHLDHMVRPVLYATFLVDWSLYGTNATGYHFLNLLLHLGSGLLVYNILSRAITEKSSHIPFGAALVFLIHPIQSETVTYISGRASGLMAFFYLLALALYVKATAFQRDSLPDRRYLFGALLSFALALGSKETAMTFPFALILWDAVIRGGGRSEFRKLFFSCHFPFWLVLLAAGAWAWWHPRYSVLAQFSFTLRPLWENVLSELHATAYSSFLFFNPWNQNFDHDLPVFHSLYQWPLPLDLLLLSAVVVAGLLSWRRFPLVTFGLGWLYIQLLPTSLIPRNDLLSERNLYLASMGLFLAVVAIASRLIHRLIAAPQYSKLVRITAGSLSITLVLALCFATVQRNTLYRDPLLLWSDTVMKSPQKARAHNNLGHFYAQRGNWDLAIDEFRIAARLDPEYVVAQENLRDAYLHHVGRR
jgi:tetratricopeptide (TPR) repeat protein